MNVLLSIRPEFADKILSGDKKYEFRKTRFRAPEKVDTVYLYSTSPTQRIVGAFTIEGVCAESPEQLWEQFGHSSGINSRERFMDYFKDKEEGYAIKIDQVLELEDVDPRKWVDDFVPPVSFYYIDENSNLDVLSQSCDNGSQDDTILKPRAEYSSD